MTSVLTLDYFCRIRRHLTNKSNSYILLLIDSERKMQYQSPTNKLTLTNWSIKHHTDFSKSTWTFCQKNGIKLSLHGILDILYKDYIFASLYLLLFITIKLDIHGFFFPVLVFVYLTKLSFYPPIWNNHKFTNLQKYQIDLRTGN